MKHLLLALPVVLVVTACSGGDDGKADAAAARTAYIAKAETICTKANADAKALKPPQSAAQLAPYVAGLVAIANKASVQIKALTPPAADKADLQKKVLDPLEGQLKEGQAYAAKVAAAAAKKDDAALTQLTLNPPKGNAADLEWMKKYGFTSCVDAVDNS